jgi:hypothetical protein
LICRNKKFNSRSRGASVINKISENSRTVEMLSGMGTAIETLQNSNAGTGESADYYRTDAGS